MIIDSIHNLPKYYQKSPRFKLVKDFLSKTELKELEVGKYEIDGENLYAIVEEAQGKGISNVRLESHLKYIDIQLVILGEDIIGYKKNNDKVKISESYDKKRDIIFYKDKISEWVRISGDNCVILFPEDLHAPLGTDKKIKKIIFKIKI